MRKTEIGSLDRIGDILKEMAKAQGAGIPTPTEADAGKVLMVDSDGTLKLADIPSQLPAVETTDEGKVLTVNSSGKWAAANLPSDETPSGDT